MCKTTSCHATAVSSQEMAMASLSLPSALCTFGSIRPCIVRAAPSRVLKAQRIFHNGLRTVPGTYRSVVRSCLQGAMAATHTESASLKDFLEDLKSVGRVGNPCWCGILCVAILTITVSHDVVITRRFELL